MFRLNCANNNISLNQSIINMMIKVSSTPTISIIYHIYNISTSTYELWWITEMMATLRERERDMCHSLFESRSPARSAIQLPDHSKHWKLLLTGVSLVLTGAPWETHPLKPWAFHHWTKMTAHTWYFVWYETVNNMRCQQRQWKVKSHRWKVAF